MGGNIRAFQDPMTLEQVFPGLRDVPGGSILSLADNVFDFTGPASELTTLMSLEYSKKLIGEIKAIDPSCHFDSLGVPVTLEGQMNQIKDLRMDRAVAAYRTQGETGRFRWKHYAFFSSTPMRHMKKACVCTKLVS